nr:hypothetical protein GCM10020063_063890 [Dactylosporangium thailandense]
MKAAARAAPGTGRRFEYEGQRLGCPLPGHSPEPGPAPSGWWAGVGEPAFTWTRAPHFGQRLMACVAVDDMAVHLR